MFFYLYAAMTFIFAAPLMSARKYQEKKIRPIPWVTTNAVSFLGDFFETNPEPAVLEFGSGSSTLWIAKRTNKLVSVEHDKNWYSIIKKKLSNINKSKSIQYILHLRPYDSVCDLFEHESFDLIIVDGRDRVQCIKKAIPLLKKGGIMMLDNSEREGYQEAIELMSPWEVRHDVQAGPDSCGFCYRGWRTSWWTKPV